MHDKIVPIVHKVASRLLISACILSSRTASFSTCTRTTSALLPWEKLSLLRSRRRFPIRRDMSSATVPNMMGTCRVWSELPKDSICQCILPLSATSHKGSSGRVAVLGGSERYTGAPYFAAMASLQTGADLATIYTAQEASVPIKCYSPELMVQSVYSATALLSPHENLRDIVKEMVNMVTDGMDRLHCLVIGPGMGRSPVVMEAVADIIRIARERNVYLVLDADALFLLAQPMYRNILRGYNRAVLTPNVVEYQRLFEQNDNEAFESVTIVQKGKVDQILVNGTVQMICHEEGGMKRAGGIGDVLAGAIGTMIAWQSILHKDQTTVDLPLACWTACCLVKRATKRAFDAKQRAMSASDILDHLGSAMKEMTKGE